MLYKLRLMKPFAIIFFWKSVPYNYVLPWLKRKKNLRSFANVL